MSRVSRAISLGPMKPGTTSPGRLSSTALPRTRMPCASARSRTQCRVARAIQRFLAVTPRESLRVFDVNLRATFYDESVIRESLAAANVLKLNADELSVVARIFELEGQAGAILAELARRFSLRRRPDARPGGSGPAWRRRAERLPGRPRRGGRHGRGRGCIHSGDDLGPAQRQFARRNQSPGLRGRSLRLFAARRHARHSR